MSSAQKVIKFEIWKASSGGNLILELQILVRFSLFFMSTYSKNLIYLAPTV